MEALLGGGAAMARPIEPAPRYVTVASPQRARGRYTSSCEVCSPTPAAGGAVPPHAGTDGRASAPTSDGGGGGGEGLDMAPGGAAAWVGRLSTERDAVEREVALAQQEVAVAKCEAAAASAAAAAVEAEARHLASASSSQPSSPCKVPPTPGARPSRGEGGVGASPLRNSFTAAEAEAEAEAAREEVRRRAAAAAPAVATSHDEMPASHAARAAEGRNSRRARGSRSSRRAGRPRQGGTTSGGVARGTIPMRGPVQRIATTATLRATVRAVLADEPLAAPAR